MMKSMWRYPIAHLGIIVLFISAIALMMPKTIIAGCDCSTNTPYKSDSFGFYYGNATIEGGGGISAGDEIRAYVDTVEVNGGCVGLFTVNTPGTYGAMSIYGDDATTVEKDGVLIGDTIYFKVCHDGNEYKSNEVTEWEAGNINNYVQLHLHFALDGPIAGFTATPIIGCPPLEVQFTNSSSGAVSYSWDFGDETTSQEKDPTHIFMRDGIYPVTLTVANECSLTDTKTDYIHVTTSVVYLDDQCTMDANKQVRFNLGIQNPSKLISSLGLEILIDTNILAFDGFSRGGLLDPGFNLEITFNESKNALEVHGSGDPIDPNNLEPEDTGLLASIDFRILKRFGMTRLELEGFEGDIAHCCSKDGSLDICSAHIEDVDPNTGPYYGGTEVEISGGHFCDETQVYFGTKQIGHNDIVSITNDKITILTPSMEEAATVHVSVKNPGVDPNISSLKNAFTYLPPWINQINPGRAMAGETVQITGDYFMDKDLIYLINDDPNDPIQVQVDPNTITFIDSTRISFKTPFWPKPCDIVYVKAADPNGPQSNLTVFTYQGPAPVITAIQLEDAQDYGSTAGGDPVLITGKHFILGNSLVYFGDKQALNTIVADPNTIYSTSPPYPRATPVDVSVTVCYDQTTIKKKGFAYRYPKGTCIGDLGEGINGWVYFYRENKRELKGKAQIINGHFELKNLSSPKYLLPNYYDLLIDIDGFLPVWTLWDPNGFHGDFNIKPAMFQIQGYVRDAFGKGIDQAQVSLVKDINQVVLTDTMGKYTLSMDVADPNTLGSLMGVASKIGYGSMAQAIFTDPNFTLIQNTEISVEFYTQGSTRVKIMASPEFGGHPHEVKIFDASSDPSVDITGSFDFNDSDKAYIYTFTKNQDSHHILILADTTQDRDVNKDYRAKKSVIYEKDKPGQPQQMVSQHVKKQAGITFGVKTKGPEIPDIILSVPPNMLSADADINIKTSFVDALASNYADTAQDPNIFVNRTKGAIILLEIDLEAQVGTCELVPGGYLEVRIPFDANVIDPYSFWMSPQNDPSHYKAYINYCQDEASLLKGIGNYIHPSHIFGPYQDGDGKFYVIARLRHLTIFFPSTAPLTPSALSDTSSEEDSAGGACFIDILTKPKGPINQFSNWFIPDRLAIH